MSADLAVLADRLDGLQVDFTDLRSGLVEVTEHGTQLADTVAELARQLAERKKPTPEPEPDWSTVEDPAEAAELLRQLVAWHDRTLARTGRGLRPCWPVHPGIVVDLLALQRQTLRAYASGGPGSVAEVAARYRPVLLKAASLELGGCRTTHAGTWEIDWDLDGLLAQVADRWVTGAPLVSEGPGMRQVEHRR